MSSRYEDNRNAGEGGTPSAGPSPSLTPTDLAVVLSHFDLGVIEAIEPIERGSIRSPKFLIRAQKGRFVVKRRLEKSDDLERVAFSHSVQSHLVSKGFPAPPLVKTARSRGTVVIHGERLYELLGYVHGTRYDGSVAQTAAAGAALARLHDILSGFAPPVAPARVAGKGELVRAQLRVIGERGTSEARRVASALEEAYARSEACLEALGVGGWSEVVIHGDWHPGNVIFSGGDVAGVTDYDTARMAPRVVDVANGIMQFSITREEGHPRTWPDHLDLDRFRAFRGGYHHVARVALGPEESRAIPALMVEAMVGESVGPIATTGRFAAIEGGAFLEMVGRKVVWIEREASRLSELIAGGGEG